MIDIPGASELSTETLSDLEGALGQTSPLLPKAFLRVLARTIGGALAGLYRTIRWLYAQIDPTTCGEEMLQRWGRRYGLEIKSAVTAVLSIQIVGAPDTQVLASSVLLGGNGLSYLQTALADIGSDGLATARVECLTSGAAGSLGVGNTLSFATPASGVSGASVLAILQEGDDEESLEDFRVRVLQRIAGQPQGGSAADYVRWALEVSGVVKAFAFRTAAGQVTIYPLADTTGDARLPSSTKIAEVLAYCDNESRRPLCAEVLVAAPTERAIDITITTLSPSDATTKAAIQSAIQAYLYAAYPRQYPDEANPTHVVSVAALWAIILYAGASAASLTMSVSGTGAVTRYELTGGEICKLGALTWA
jgi:uncharacterized phage protein gp47/JayE